MSTATRSWNPVKEKTKPDVLNKEGVPSYSETAEFELADILLSSFGKEESFYESGDDKFDRLNRLLKKVTPEFAAQVAIMARHKFHMRNLPAYCAGFVLLSRPNADWKKNFFANYPVRADDPLEIMGAAEVILGRKFTKFPKFLQKGFGEYLSSLDAYRLAKYSVNVAHKQKASRWKLIDLVNICHPKHTPQLEALVKGTLTKADTHEASVTAKVNAALAEAGDEADREEVKADAKREDWERLLIDGRLGYMALLKNVRNVLLNKVSAKAREAMITQLIDPLRISQSRVLPFRYLSAYKALGALVGQVDGVPEALTALSVAVGISLGNVPILNGKTVCLVDESGSMMTTPINDRLGHMEEWMKIQAGEIAMLFAAAMAVRGADTVLFGDAARQVRINPANSLFAAVDLLPRRGQGTNLPAAFEILTGKYDRIIILSDMQSWLGGSCEASLMRYKARTGANPKVFSWSLVPYGTQALGAVNLMSGWSDKAFDQILWCEQDRNGLVNRIKEIDLHGKF